MAITIDISSIAKSADGKRYSAYRAGNAPVGGGSGDFTWSASSGVLDGEQITLTATTADFGSGPAESMYEGYNNGTLGSLIETSNTSFTSTSGGSTNKAIRDSEARSGQFSADVWRENTPSGGWRALALIYDFAAPASEVFVSYAVKIPAGYSFPGEDSLGNPITSTTEFSANSSWKFAWLHGGNTTDRNDIVLPTHIGNGNFRLTGNDLNSTLINPGNTWWKWDNNWKRCTSWLKGGSPNPETDAGTSYFQVANSTDPLYEFTSTSAIFSGGNSPYDWSELQVPGWMSGWGSAENIKVLYDDVYIAVGNNAAARVEIGDNAIYENCTNLAICDSVSWNSGEIVANIRRGGMNLSNPTWLFITLGDNVTRMSVQVVS